MNKLKLFLKTLTVYFVGNVLSRLINFFMLPLYTNKLTPDQFGTYDLNMTILNLVLPIIFMQIWDGLYRYGFEKKEPNEKYSIVSNSYFFWCLSLILYTIVYLSTGRLFIVQDSILVFLVGLSTAANYQYIYIARAFLKNNLFVISGIINTLLVAVLNIVLITVYNLGLKSLYISSIAGFVIQALIIELFLHPIKSFRFSHVDRNIIRQMLKFTIPLSFTTISYWLLDGYTKLSISAYLGTYANGLYAVASKFSLIITLFVMIGQFAWNEMAYIIADEDEHAAKYEMGIKYIFIIAVIGSSALMLVIKIIFPLFVSDIYKEALLLIPFSLIGITANAFANFLSILFLAEKKTKWILIITLIVAVLNVVMQLSSASLLGLQGFVALLCLSFLILAALRLYTTKKILKINFSSKNYLYLFALVFSVLIFYFVNSYIVMCLYIVLLGLLLTYSLRDLLSIIVGQKKLIKKKKSYCEN